MYKIKVKKIPDIALLNPKEASKLLEREGRIAVNDMLIKFQNDIVALTPRGVTGILAGAIQTKIWDFIDLIKGKVFVGSAASKYGIVQDQGRKKAWVSREGQLSLARWILKAPAGQAFFAKLKAKYPKITPRAAVFLIARSMSRKARQGKKFFSKGIKNALPDVNSIWRKYGLRISLELMK